MAFSKWNQLSQDAKDIWDDLPDEANNVVHLDIQPSNIIVSRAGTDWVVQVIDWGCAARKNERLKYYRGCPPYSHRSLLQCQGSNPWTPGAVHDHVSFALTVAHLVAGTKTVPWKDCNGLQLADSVVEDRRKIAVNLLNDIIHLIPEVTTLLGYIDVTHNLKRNNEDFPEEAPTKMQKAVRPQAATTQATSGPRYP
jgi:serine/threonine protein kinase